jgi:hypothetical protein
MFYTTRIKAQFTILYCDVVTHVYHQNLLCLHNCNYCKNLSFSLFNQPSAESEMKPCDNVLPGQDCHTLQGVVVDEYGAMME